MRWLALLLLFPAFVWAQPACYPYTGNPAAKMGAVKLHADGAYWTWYCWTGKEWMGYGRTFHRTDIARTGVDIGARARQIEDAPESERAALMATFDLPNTSCEQMIANAGYAANLCLAMLTDLRANFPAPVAAPPPEVWLVTKSGTAIDRPTRFWPYAYTAGGAIRNSPERAAVGSACDPAVGTGNYRGVLGRSDRVAVCAKQ